MAISDLWNIEFLTSTIPAIKSKILRIKKNGVNVEKLVTVNHHAIFQTDMSIFGTNLVLQHNAKLWRHIQKQDFWEFYLIYRKTNDIIGFLSSFRIGNMYFFKISKFKIWRFWPVLELDFNFFDKIKLNGILAIILEFYVEIGT